MHPFPLRLDYYFITNITVKAVPNSGIESVDLYNVDEDDFQIEFAVQNEDEDEMIQCNIIIKSTECLPYDFDIEVVGFFSFTRRMGESEKFLYLVNAPATLYSIAREQLASLSAHGPYKKIILPLIDARGFQIQESEEPKPKRKATSKKKTSSKKSTKKKATRKKS